MIRIHFDEATRDELKALRRDDLPHKVRDRIDMVSLADAGWSAPKIAGHLGYHPQTVRDLLRAVRDRGLDALRPRRSGPPPDAARYGRVADAIRELLGRKRTWSSRQVGEELARQGIPLGPRQVRRYLRRIGARYRRTATTLKHKQDPAKAQRAGRVLANLKARAAEGRLKLDFLDECGFAPTLPVGGSWALPGERKLIEYEAPQGRRVNALAAYRPYGRAPRLDVSAAERTWTSPDLLAFLERLPWSKVPRVVALDNAGLHTSRVIRRARRGLARRGLYLYYLPAYSPDLNAIEGLFRQVKYHEMPERSYTTRTGLRDAVEAAFAGYGRKLRRKPTERLRPAA